MAEVKMSDATGRDPCEAVGMWPVRLVAGGIEGWSLWCSGHQDLLLARAGRTQVFGSRDALLAALLSPDSGLTPAVAVALDADTARQVVAARAAVFDLDAAAAWFARPDRQASVEDCAMALNAINMAIDIGATAGDEQLAAIVASHHLSYIADVLTLGLTLLGDGGPYRGDPRAMASAITPDSAAAVASLIELAAGHIEAR